MSGGEGTKNYRLVGADRVPLCEREGLRRSVPTRPQEKRVNLGLTLILVGVEI